MLMPSIYRENLFDDFFGNVFDDFPFFGDKDLKKAEKKLYGSKAGRLMCTDVKEKDGSFELEMDLPGFKKEEIQASLENGYLTVSATKGYDGSEENKDNGKYIRKERYSGSCSRSFYVGEDIKQDDIKAEFKHGILKLIIPKKEEVPQVEQNKYIAIEG